MDDTVTDAQHVPAAPLAPAGTPCAACSCASCLRDRAEVRDWMQKVALALVSAADRQRADDLHTHPLTRALIDEQRSKQRLGAVIAEFLAGKANREALAFTLVNELGAKS